MAAVTTRFTRLGDGFGFVTNELDAFEALKEFETATVTKYCFYYSKGYSSKAGAGEYMFVNYINRSRIQAQQVPFIHFGKSPSFSYAIDVNGACGVSIVKTCTCSTMYNEYIYWEPPPPLL